MNNEALRESNALEWHEQSYQGEGVHVVIFDMKATPHKHMENYAVSPFVSKPTISHGTNVAQCIHVSAPKAKVTMLYSGKESRQWFEDNHETVDIVNISMSASHDLALHSWGLLEQYDIPVFCSSGNYSKTGELDDEEYPAKFDWTIGVGAYNHFDKGINKNDVTNYSNGGEGLICVSPTNIEVEGSNENLFTFSGTSASSPFLSGLVACYIGLKKKLGKQVTRKEIFSFLIENCLDIREPGFDLKSGHGLFMLPSIESVIEREVVKVMEQYFSDVGKTSAMFNDVQELVDKGIISGYTDGTFRPNEVVTRGQISILLNRTIKHITSEILNK